MTDDRRMPHERIMPIMIREDMTVRIQGLPHDLTKAEAEKIERVVLAMVEKPNDR